MRIAFVALALAGALTAASAANAEKRLFIVANDGNGYGVERCLASGAACGAAMAAAYCRSRDYAQAGSFRKIDRDEITGAVPTSTSATCKGGGCDEFVAIECSR